MKAWGVALSPDKVVGDRRAAMQVQAMSNGRAVITQYLPWLTLDKDALDQNDVVTGQLEVLRLFSAGALVQLPGATTKLEPLVQSSPDSMLIDAQQLQHDARSGRPHERVPAERPELSAGGAHQRSGQERLSRWTAGAAQGGRCRRRQHGQHGRHDGAGRAGAQGIEPADQPGGGRRCRHAVRRGLAQHPAGRRRPDWPCRSPTTPIS